MWLLVVLFLGAFGIRMWQITAPPLDFHSGRQYRAASIARGFYVRGNDSLPDWEREIGRLNQFQDGLLEPPMLELITAAMWRLSGGERLWMPKTLASICWLIGGWFLFRLARRFLLPTASLLALAVYLFIPYGILNSRSFQPEPIMVMGLIVALDLIYRHRLEPSRRNLTLAIVASAAAMFVKPTCVFAIFAAFGLLHVERDGWARTLKSRGIYVFGTLSLLPCIVYYGWGLLTVDKLQNQADVSFILALWFDAEFWTRWLEMIGRTAGIVLVGLALWSLRLLNKGPQRALLVALFVSYALYGLTFNYHIHTHDYYSLQLVPTMSLGLGPALACLLGWAGKQWAISKWRILIPVALVAAIPVGGIVWLKSGNLKSVDERIKDRIESSLLLFGMSSKVFMFVNPDYYGFARRAEIEKNVGDVVGHTPSAIMLTPDLGLSLVYNAQISGIFWPDEASIRADRIKGEPEMTAAERFQSKYAGKGFEYFIITDFGELEKQPDLKPFLDKTFALHAFDENSHLVYRLKAPSPDTSPQP